MIDVPSLLQPYLLLSDAVIITDQYHIILACNERFTTITGYTKDMARGEKAGFFKANITPTEVYASLSASLKRNEPWSGVLYNRKRTGELWHSSIAITPLNIEGERYYIGVFRELEQLPQGIYFSESRMIEVKRELFRVLAVSCEIRDPGIEEHLVHVRDLTELLVRAHCAKHQLQFDSAYIHSIIHSSIMHDIGKAEIPEGILYKPGKLTGYERTIIELHPLMGAEILKKISYATSNDFMKNLTVAENIILYHHERWDGTGYPYRLKGEDIPFEARIVAIVDVFDALTSRRAYKEAWSEESALAYIKEKRGKQFDPSITDTFIELF